MGLVVRATFAVSAMVAVSTARAAIPNDPGFEQQWALLNLGQTVNGRAGEPGADVAAPEAWAVHGGASNVIVAIVGTGVDPHPEFADRLLEGYVTPLAGGDPYSTLDTANHGTRIAGIIGAARNDGVGIAGLNDRATILPVRVFDGALGTEASAAQGIIWAAGAGAHVIVVALQFPEPTQDLADAVAYAASHDAVVIAPSGNDGNEGVAFPAAFEGCLGVASTDMLDAAAEFSNHGGEVDLAAPSVDIWSTRASGGYGFEDRGTSAWAAAYVGGVASLIRSYAPQLTAAQVRQILMDSADDLGDPGWDPKFGAGRLNAGRALRMATPPAIRFELLERLPATIRPGSPTELTIRIVDGIEHVVPAATRLFHRVPPAAFTAAPLQHLGSDLYRVVLPATACGSTLEYFLRATGDAGAIRFDPPGAPSTLHHATAIQSIRLFDDDFEEDRGWTTIVEGEPATTGDWTRDAPIGTTAQPAYDFSPDYGQRCFLTGQFIGGDAGTSDVDGGPVGLVSPVVLLPTADAEVSYARWFHSTEGTTDVLTVEMSRDGGATWAVVEELAATETWTMHAFRLSEFPEVSGNALVLRFTAADLTDDSLTEAAIDEVYVRGLTCSIVRGDVDGDGDVDDEDFGRSAECWHGPGVRELPAPCELFDFDADGDADLEDFRYLQNRFVAGVDDP